MKYISIDTFYFAKLPLVLLLSLCFLSCYQSESSKSDPIARVGTKYLYRSDLQYALPPQISQDSASIIASFIDDWVSRQVFLRKAKNMLSEREKKSIDAKVSVYKEDLLVHAYKVKALETRFRDTMVSQTDIEKAYHENQRIIRLSDDLIRVVYVFLDQDSNLKSRVRKILRDMDDQDAFMDLKNICQTHSKKFNINRSKWFTYSNLKRDLPFLEQKNLRSLRFDRVYSFSSGDSKAFCYFIKIVHRGSPAPIDYVKTKLKTIVINRRKLKFVKQLKRSLYKETIKTKDYEVFIKK